MCLGAHGVRTCAVGTVCPDNAPLSGPNLLLFQLVCPLVTSNTAEPLLRSCCQGEGVASSKVTSLLEAACIQWLGRSSNAAQFRGASSTKKSLYIYLLKSHPGLTSITAQSCLHSIMGLFLREIPKNSQYAIPDHWKPT